MNQPRRNQPRRHGGTEKCEFTILVLCARLLDWSIEKEKGFSVALFLRGELLFVSEAAL